MNLPRGRFRLQGNLGIAETGSELRDFLTGLRELTESGFVQQGMGFRPGYGQVQGENWSIEFGVALLVVCQNTQVASPFPPVETCWHRGKSMEIPQFRENFENFIFFPMMLGASGSK